MLIFIHLTTIYLFFCFILRITSFIHTFHSYKTKIGKSCVCVYFYYMTLPLFSYMEFCFYFPYALLVCIYCRTMNMTTIFFYLFCILEGGMYFCMYCECDIFYWKKFSSARDDDLFFFSPLQFYMFYVYKNNTHTHIMNSNN